MKLKDIRCCGLINPVGLDAESLTFSWKIVSGRKNVLQKAFRVKILDAKTGEIIWDSALRESAEQRVTFSDVRKLRSGRRYRYQVTVVDNQGEQAADDGGTFSLAIRRDEWKARWIGVQEEDLNKNVKMATKQEMADAFKASFMNNGFDKKAERELEPLRIYRKTFTVKSGLEEAWLSITAHGVYDVKINGQPVSDTRFNPGFTAYQSYLEFQTYEVGALLKEGENVMTVILADGWYRGTFGILGYGNNYGTELALLAQLSLEYASGEKDLIVTDETFRYGRSSWIYSDLMIGEKQDGRIDDSLLDDPDYEESLLKPAKVKNYDYQALRGVRCEPVKITQVLPAKEVLTSPTGETIVDLGQVMVGGIRLEVNGEAGTEIKMEFTEVLDKDGTFLNNISGVNRDQTDYYILGGGKTEYYEPKYTFHGFRYVKITGYPGRLTADRVTGLVLGTALEQTGTFHCSDERLNRLQSNIQWSQRGNMLSIPTDCPQRERAGWTGDIYVFSNTAAYNQNVRAFLDKWLDNMAIEQFDDGLIPVIVPYPLGYNAMQKDAFGTDTSAGWGDAAVKVPWVLYNVYGDPEILRRHFDMMKGWMDYVENYVSGNIPELEGDISPERLERQKYLWNTGFNFGDWCYPSCKNENGGTDMFRSAFTTKEHVATAMYAASTDMMAKICTLLGKTELAAHYSDLNRRIRRAFSDEYIREDGSIDNAVQGIYVLALAMHLADGDKYLKTAEHLVRMIHDNGDRLDTGFLSIEHLMDVLTDTGHSDVARAILYQDKCPSWLYEVKNGATTTWEIWDAIMEDGTRTRESHNHYAFGCVGSWMYRTLAGIRPEEPGYRRFRIAPSFDFGLTDTEGSFESVYGTIKSAWSLKDGKGVLKAEIPVGTTAEIVLPGIREEVGSGSCEFSFQIETAN